MDHRWLDIAEAIRTVGVREYRDALIVFANAKYPGVVQVPSEQSFRAWMKESNAPEHIVRLCEEMAKGG